VINIIAPAFAIVLIGMLQFCLAPDDSTRFEVSIGLVLVAVLFKLSFVSPDNFPTVAYSTLLDKYMHSLNVLILLMASENGVVCLIASKSWGADVCDPQRAVWLDFWDNRSVVFGDGDEELRKRQLCATQIDCVCFIFLGSLLVLIGVLFSVRFRLAYVRGTHLEDLREHLKDLRALAKKHNLKVFDNDDKGAEEASRRSAALVQYLGQYISRGSSWGSGSSPSDVRSRQREGLNQMRKKADPEEINAANTVISEPSTPATSFRT